MKNIVEVQLSKMPGWHRGMGVYALSISDNRIYKLPVIKSADKFCPQENNLYISAMNIKVAETKLRKRADKIIKAYNDSRKLEKKQLPEPTFIMT